MSRDQDGHEARRRAWKEGVGATTEEETRVEEAMQALFRHRQLCLYPCQSLARHLPLAWVQTR